MGNAAVATFVGQSKEPTLTELPHPSALVPLFPLSNPQAKAACERLPGKGFQESPWWAFPALRLCVHPGGWGALTELSLPPDLGGSSQMNFLLEPTSAPCSSRCLFHPHHHMHTSCLPFKIQLKATSSRAALPFRLLLPLKGVWSLSGPL